MSYLWADVTEVIDDPELDGRGLPIEGNYQVTYECKSSRSGVSLEVGMDILKIVGTLKQDDHDAAIAFLNKYGPWRLGNYHNSFDFLPQEAHARDGHYLRTGHWWAEVISVKRVLWLHQVLRENPEHAHALAKAYPSDDDSLRIKVEWPPFLEPYKFKDAFDVQIPVREKPTEEVCLWTYLAEAVCNGLLRSQSAETVSYDINCGRIIRDHRAYIGIGSIVWRLLADLVTEVHRDKICDECFKPFQAKRKDKKFCSDACRSAFSRRRGAKPAAKSASKSIEHQPITRFIGPEDEPLFDLATGEMYVPEDDDLGIDDIPF